MSTRIAASFGLVAFALCLAQGIFAENSFTTIILRAVQALVVSLVVGGIIGVVLDKMLAENLAKTATMEDSAAEAESAGR